MSDITQSSIAMIEKQGTTLRPRVPMAWREECVLGAFPVAMAFVQDGTTGFTGVAVIDHLYSTRTGSSSCSPPV
ncbi:hypothetical protein [uncultured Friedmanniella sp.]|uniref:hypothetical protein n=1 Tax=uncultured Friedmanniella sp. TaxID=335381 RepID=UPI0035CB5AF7